MEFHTRVPVDPELNDPVARFERKMGEPWADIGELRRRYAALLSEQGSPANPVPTRDLKIPTRHGEISARLYLPKHEGRLPLLVYMHGGGFMVGDLESLDVPLHQLSRDARIAILSLDYALAPENRYPLALEQCEDALTWAATHAKDLGAPGRLGVAGDSAGGNFTALLAMRARDAGGPTLSWQAMINPGLDMPGVANRATTSARLYGDGPIVTIDMLKLFMAAYFPSEAATIESSPLLASNLRNLPPAFIAGGQCDPLRDDGVAYAARLAAAGVPVESHVYPGMPHNFMTMTHVSRTARGFLADLAVAAHEALHAS